MPRLLRFIRRLVEKKNDYRRHNEYLVSLNERLDAENSRLRLRLWEATLRLRLDRFEADEAAGD